MADITVELNNGKSPCIKIDKIDAIPEYIRKENITKVTTFSVTDLTAKTGAARDEKYIVKIYLADGSDLYFDIQDVSNQPTWTTNDAGLDQAATDIAQAT